MPGPMQAGIDDTRLAAAESDDEPKRAIIELIVANHEVPQAPQCCYGDISI